LQEHHVTPDTIGSWYEDVFARGLTEGSALLEERIENASENAVRAYLHTSLGNELLDTLSALYPNIDFHSVTPEDIRLPDFDLYRKGKEMYLAIMTEKQAAESESVKRSSEFFVTESVKLDTLEKYGALLTEYPILLEYMKLNGITDISDIDVREALSEME